MAKTTPVEGAPEAIAAAPTKPTFFQTLIQDAQAWTKENGLFWAGSIGAHVVMLGMAALVFKAAEKVIEGAAPTFETVMDTSLPEPELTHFEVGDTALEPTELTTESLMLTEAPEIAQEAEYNDDSNIFVEAGGGVKGGTDLSGGLGGFTVAATGGGPAVLGGGGVGAGAGEGTHGGAGGAGKGFGGRGSGSRAAMAGAFGGTKSTERSVGAGLNWLARHQNPDGSWSFDGFTRKCTKDPCDGEGKTNSDPGATAFALLPFLAAGQTHETNGPYRAVIAKGLDYMVRIETPDGKLYGKTGGGARMYVQGVATIVLCEAYGMSKDEKLRKPAQAAINFITKSQHPEQGGWRYYIAGEKPTEGDTSVVGWQLMAYKSALMSGLEVDPNSMKLAGKYMLSVAKGEKKGLYSYTADSGPTPAMTAVGLLCRQLLGVKKDDPSMKEGMDYLLKNLPGKSARNSYYFYYATQVMHNLPGPEWDTWNRATRQYLINTQVKEGCAAGSWDPAKPAPDSHADAGGRVMVTSINTLSLEVYYRFLPLYQIDRLEGDSMVSSDGPRPSGLALEKK